MRMSPAQIVIFLALVLIVPALFAVVLRAARAPGWSVLGGLAAGVIIGPSILGRVAPQMYESIFVGGVEQREAMESLARRHAAERLAAEQLMTEHGAPDRDFVGEMRDAQAADREPFEQSLREARWDHQRPQRYITALIVLLALLGGAAAQQPTRGPSQSIINAFSIGTWAAGLPGMLAYFAASRWWGYGPWESLLAAGAVAIGPWALTRIDRGIADEVEHGGAAMIRAAGRVTSVIALAAVVIALWQLRGTSGVMYATPLMALPAAWLIPAGFLPRGIEPVVRMVLLPALTAVVAMRVDLYQHAAFWPIVVLLLLSGDGRWIGGVIGAMALGGRRGLRTMRLVLGMMACGPTQIAIAAIGVSAWLLPEELAFALLLGAVLVEVMTPMRRSLARQLADAEEQLSSEQD